MPDAAHRAMPGDARQPASLHLTRIMMIVMAGAFVTALGLATGDMQTFWPLYVVPVVIAALSYHVAGAVVTAAAATALVALFTPGAGLMTAALPELVVGLTAFLLAGIVIGSQASHQRNHNLLLEDASILDQLTGLFKPEHLRLRLAEEMRRGDRYETKVAYLLVCVEEFEHFKEQFGHYKADLLLEHLADILKVTVRSTDVVGRHGAVSFGIVLPFATPEGAQAVVERVSAAVAEAEFEGDVLEPATSASVTVVYVLYPDEVADRKEAIQLAEKRLAESAASCAPALDPEADEAAARLADATGGSMRSSEEGAHS